MSPSRFHENTIFMRLLPLLILCFSLQINAQIDSTGLPTEANEIIVYPLENVNSTFRDINLSITPNGKYLYFMSGRGEAPWSTARHTTYKGQEEFDGDIWYSEKADTTWQQPKHLPKTVNTGRGEDEPNISPDAQTVYFQSWKTGWERTGGPYYQAELYGDTWENSRGLFGGINQFFIDSLYKYGGYATDGMAISPDQRIFIVAAGPYYDGRMDLYISRKNERSKWTYPKKLAISTNGDERSIFIAADNQTIYFASDGHGGLGGKDILKTTLHDDNTLGEIINIGQPFNTTQDDYGFIIGALGTDAYFVREGDIYYAKLDKASDSIKPNPTLLIEGKIVNCDGQPQQAQVELYDLASNTLLTSARSNSISGKYALSFLKKEGKYVQHIKYKATNEVISIPFEIKATSENAQFYEIKPECEEQQEIIDLIEPIELFVYFDFDKSDLKAVEKNKLDGLLQQLQDLPEGSLEIIGHTDSKGSDSYNLALSERRAKSVKAYLENTSNDIKFSFEGEKLPIVNNNSADNRAKNRRVRVRWEILNK